MQCGRPDMYTGTRAFLSELPTEIAHKSALKRRTLSPQRPAIGSQHSTSPSLPRIASGFAPPPLHPSTSNLVPLHA